MVITLISICFILIILIAVFAVLFQANNSKHNQANIKITEFSIDKQWGYVGGLAMDCRFNLTIENKGVDNVTDLVLDVKMFHNNSELQVGNYFFGTYENGTIIKSLSAGEVREFKGIIMSTVGDDAYRYLRSNETSIIAFVTLDNVVLDQRK